MKLWTSSILSAAILGTLAACSSAPAPETAPATVPETTAVSAPKKDSLTTLKERYSYALGMDMGRAIKNIEADLDQELFLRSLSDQMSGKPLLMTDSQAEKALQELVLQMQVEKEKKAAAAAQAALDSQKTFLEKNKTVEGVVVTPSGLQYKYIVKAQDSTAKSPKLTDKVRVHYAGSLLDGSEFDSSIKRGEPLEFPVNAVIQGWQELLTLMKEGEKMQAWIPSNLGYGEAGAPPVIPANALLVFEVELLDVVSDEPSVEASKSPSDSAQVQAADSAAAPAMTKQDSLAAAKAAKKAEQDSIKAAKKAKADSLAAVKKAKQDSIAAAKAAKKAEQDSIKAAKKAAADSLAAVKKAKQDSVKAAKKAKADSLAAAKAAKKAEQDSIKAAKKAKADSLAAVKKAKQDSIAAAKAAKKAEQDSIKAAKKAAADSLASAKKAEKENAEAAKQASADSAKTAIVQTPAVDSSKAQAPAKQ